MESILSERLELKGEREALNRERVDHAETVNRLTQSLKVLCNYIWCVWGCLLLGGVYSMCTFLFGDNYSLWLSNTTALHHYVC